MPQLPSYDPLDVPAPLDELKAARLLCFLAPVEDDQNRVFQFNLEDEKTMEDTLLVLNTDPTLSLNWRLLDNSEVSVNAVSLASILDELRLKRALRGVQVDAEYMVFKTNGVTRREIKTWCEVYGVVPD